ncbi:hypothetical protein Tco_0432364 [Tanacetum coccineum]
MKGAPKLTKCLNEHVPKTMEEMMIAATAFIRGEAAAAGKKKGHASWRAHDQSKRHTSERRMTRQRVTQSFELVSEITFPSLTTSSGTEGPLVIEAEIGGHMIHRMYVDGAHEMLKFPVDGGIVTIRSTILIPAECATVITSSKEIPKEAGVCHENFKVALHPNFPDQEVAIGGTLSAKGRTELCSLLQENLDIFAWQVKRVKNKAKTGIFGFVSIENAIFKIKTKS